jgi:hypothetical protein
VAIILVRGCWFKILSLETTRGLTLAGLTPTVALREKREREKLLYKSPNLFLHPIEGLSPSSAPKGTERIPHLTH